MILYYTIRIAAHNLANRMLHTTNYQAFQVLSHDSDQPTISFQGAEAAGRALPGDFVEWDTSAGVSTNGTEKQYCILVNRTIHPPLTGLLDVCSKTIYGMTSRHVPIFLFYPYDKRYPPMRVGCSTADRSTNLLVKVRFESWEAGETFPRANLETVIGTVGDIISESRALVSFASPFWRSKVSYTAPTAEVGSHKQLEDADTWHIFHIDPAGCRDVDDICGVRARPDGRTDILIGISDVAAYIPHGSTLDLVARHNTSTVYTLGGLAACPMFPAALSEELFSLAPAAAQKPVVALTAIYDGNQITDIQFKELLVQVDATYSYEDVYTCAPTLVKETLSNIAATIARRIAGLEPILNVKEISRDSHCWIEQLMVFYNLEAAAQIAPSGRAILRSHEAAAPEAVDAVSILPEDLRWIASKPAEYISSTSSVADKVAIHSSFKAMYCHATSPIRRYADLHNQRVLKAILNNSPAVAPKTDNYLIAHLNQRQKILKQYQRNLTFITNILSDSSITTVEATVVAIGEVKATLWIPVWKSLVKTLEYDGLSIGDNLSLRFYYNPNRPNWKERIVFERAA